ncbi:M3 family metallopeptidase [Salininema proteolyticum]|uniref:M3 family metallopeptidase n=1 Tax=Salininema proteolyticum TaxID=1607685 RepID=A0ABV8U1H6_9ACTN
MSATDVNPLLTPSRLPYQVPPFQEITPDHYREGFAKGIAEQAEAVAAVASQEAAPTFDNTVVELERVLNGGILDRTATAFFTVNAADTSPDLEDIEAEVSPELAAHDDSIYLNKALAERVDALWEGREDADYTPEQLYLLERYRTRFQRAGASLDDSGRERLEEINTRLAELHAAFNRQTRADINEAAVLVDSAERLEGLSEAGIAAAKAAATDRGKDGYLIGMELFSANPALADLADRDLRREVWEASTGRGKANAPTILEIVGLRAEKARLLGYANFADYVAADVTARSGAAVWERLTAMVAPAVRNARNEAEQLKKAVDAEGGDFKLAAWDWKYYAGKVKAEKYGFDPEELKPYLELDTILEHGVFYAAEKEFGLTFHARPDIAGYLPEVRVWEVRDEDGSVLGLFFGDFFTRESKRGGAWMNNLVDQNALAGTKPVVINNLNIVKPAEGKPALVTVDNVRTLFHEFGHALHGLMSDCEYPTPSGTSVPRDFVEYPSQVNEMWILWPEVAANYVKHHETGESAPAELLEQWKTSNGFGAGFAKTEYLAAALLDQAWHRLAPEDVPTAEGRDAVEVVEEFERNALEEIGIRMDEIAPRYRSGYFAHTFTGGYASGYYSYVWSEVLDADTVDWFKENGGLTRANGDHFRETLLSRGSSIDPLESFRRFRGRDPEIEPLLKRHGLQ